MKLVMEKTCTEEPPGSGLFLTSEGAPPFPWQEVSPERWADWRWQMTHRLRSIEDFAGFLDLTPQERIGLSTPEGFRVDVTPYFASLMDPHDPNCPIRRQVLPTSLEFVPFDAELVDSLGEDAHSPVPGLVHRYPDRVLMLVTTQCASYCRFCTRSRLVGDGGMTFNAAAFDRQNSYIAATPEIRDVLLSGGDPLTLPERVLDGLLARMQAIPHVEVVRIGSRVPIFLPQRITPDLTAMLARHHPLWMNIHINHPKEITPEAAQALGRLADAGIPLGSQTVLMAGINDCPNVMKALVHKLVANRVRPYYLYQCDLVHGGGHFRTPVAKGIEIIESLRGHTSGFAVPTFVIDTPEGGGKVPIGPNYLLSMSEHQVVVRNYEGVITAYAEPDVYQSHNSSTCAYCAAQRMERGQEGVAALLTGHRRKIAPEDWHHTHARTASPSEPPIIGPTVEVGEAYNG